MSDDSWKVYRHDGQAHTEDLERWLSTPPPWRTPGTGVGNLDRQVALTTQSERRGSTYISSTRFEAPEKPTVEEETRINIALMLRRPLLVTGKPGIGKSSLAYHLAWALGLGEPLRWEINSRTTLADGLYRYDAVSHLRVIQEATAGLHRGQTEGAEEQAKHDNIGEFITLGPLGTALLPTQRPRVLLVDELDKASFDLPNDLLHVFEEGAYDIPELVRCGGEQRVIPCDHHPTLNRVPVVDGRVRTRHHPVVVITSNAEREFPEAFLRRCVGLELPVPGPEHLRAIVERLLKEEITEGEDGLIAQAQVRYAKQPTDVVLQGLFVERSHGVPGEAAARILKRG